MGGEVGSEVVAIVVVGGVLDCEVGLVVGDKIDYEVGIDYASGVRFRSTLSCMLIPFVCDVNFVLILVSGSSVAYHPRSLGGL